jgi:type II secretory pathway pseudopilin PulG
MSPSQASAFTLIELVVVTGIVALLAAILLPVLTRARLNGAIADDLAKLKQLGMAEALYAEQSGGHCYDPVTLVNEGYAPSALLASGADYTAGGFGNAALKVQNPRPKAPDYKVSYLSLGGTLGMWDTSSQSLTHDTYRPLFERDPAAGWLVSSAPLEACHPSPDYEFWEPTPWESWMRRLRVDTSVSTPFCIVHKMPSGHTGYCTVSAFFDASQVCGSVSP